MSEVTIEGSSSPSTFLARGARLKVQLTDQVRRLIQRGFVVVIPEDAAPPVIDAPAPEPTAEDAPGDLDSPARNATRREWADFLTSQGIEFEDDETRADLIESWEAVEADRSAPTED